MQVSLEPKSSTCQHQQLQVPQRDVSPSPTASILSTHAHFCLHCLRPPVGPVSVRCHPAPEAPSNSIGLEAIIRKALMGNYDDQSEERTSSNATNPGSISTGAAVDGRAEEFFSQGAL